MAESKGIRFVEVYVSTPLSVCEDRDTKGLYKKARAGIIPQFTGIDSPYEPPLHPDVELPTERFSVEECLALIEKSIAS
jgi:adenylylsulfate kinase-like enzyme